MFRLARMTLFLVLLLAVVRGILFLIYAAYRLPSPLEAFHCESLMVHLAWRAQHGLRLYPDWRAYPYVANFYGPVYPVAVGLIGRAVGASLEGLFLIGRLVTFGTTLAGVLVVGGLLWRRHGSGAAWLGMALGLGSAPLFGFGVMVRADVLADVLGFTGFVLACRRPYVWTWVGGATLVLAVLTKQTAAAYLLAAALALFLEGRRARALGLVGGSALAGLAIVVLVDWLAEPVFSRTSWRQPRCPGHRRTGGFSSAAWSGPARSCWCCRWWALCSGTRAGVMT